MDWIEFALTQGHGICSLGNHRAVFYGTNADVCTRGWVFVPSTTDKEIDRQGLMMAFEYFDKAEREAQ